MDRLAQARRKSPKVGLGDVEKRQRLQPRLGRSHGAGNPLSPRSSVGWQIVSVSFEFHFLAWTGWRKQGVNPRRLAWAMWKSGSVYNPDWVGRTAQEIR